MLLNHSSGYENGVHVAEAAKAFGIGRDDLTADQLVRYSLGRPLEYAPGTQARYSNAGYVVLGEIVAHLGGPPYEEYVTRQVLAAWEFATPRWGRGRRRIRPIGSTATTTRGRNSIRCPRPRAGPPVSG